MKKISKWISHNQGQFLSLVVVMVISVYVFGCPPKVTSLLHPGEMVTADELTLELAAESRRLEADLDSLLERARLKQSELARRAEIKAKLLNFLAITVDGGTVNPAGAVGLLFSVLGAGAFVDNRIKDKVIKNRPLYHEPLE